MSKKRTSPKVDLEYLVHITIDEFGLDRSNIDAPNLKKYIRNIFGYMYRLDKLRFKFDTEMDRIIAANKAVKDPEYDEQDIKNILQQIKHIDNLPKHEQRSPEWYNFRRQNITASSIGYICKTKSGYYEEIRKKCSDNTKMLSNPAIMHGVKYEAVATAIYERRHQLKVLEYGCLPHKYVNNLAASPDGICDYSPENPSYTGRMLEIKCPYSRQITGIIPECYYYQIQAQLEVCDLNYCDYLECKLVDFNSFDEMSDHLTTISNNAFRNDEYGVLLEYMMPYDNVTRYAYSEIGLPEDELEEWINLKTDELNEEDPNFRLDKILYWVLEYSNTVLVKRDRLFFDRMLPTIKAFWKDVEYFRSNPEELNDYISNAKPKNDYYAIDLLVNKNSDSDSEKSDLDKSNKLIQDDEAPDKKKKKRNKKDKENDKEPFGVKSDCLLIDSDTEGEVIIKADDPPLKKKSPKNKTMKEHFKNKKIDKSKFKNIAAFSGCMID
jgi:putative phage-type endonuclease